jgi:hypothetical protein
MLLGEYMKIVSVLLMFVMLGVAANAQDAKVIAEIAASSERLVKGAPFSADAISESVQTLADGNRIVRSSTSKLYRNGEGRFRREMTGGSGGSLFTYAPGVTLLDPAGGFRYMIDSDLKTTRQVMVRPGSEVKIVSGQGLSTTIGGSMAEKLKAEIKAAAAAGATTVDGAVISEKLKFEIKTAVAAAPAIAARAVTGQILAEGLGGVGMGGGGMVYSTGSHSKWETRTEELGTQNIEGVDAEGKRTITTIPAGAIGNERPIEITYEKWYSRELQLVVMSKHNDPRFGEQTYRLTNIIRSEPDPSLFTLPNGYKMITEPYERYTPAARRPTHATTVTRTRP